MITWFLMYDRQYKHLFFDCVKHLRGPGWYRFECPEELISMYYVEMYTYLKENEMSDSEIDELFRDYGGEPVK